MSTKRGRSVAHYALDVQGSDAVDWSGEGSCSSAGCLRNGLRSARSSAEHASVRRADPGRLDLASTDLRGSDPGWADPPEVAIDQPTGTAGHGRPGRGDGAADVDVHRSRRPHSARYGIGHRISRAARCRGGPQPPQERTGLAGAGSARRRRADPAVGGSSRPGGRGLRARCSSRLGRLHPAHPAGRGRTRGIAGSGHLVYHCCPGHFTVRSDGRHARDDPDDRPPGPRSGDSGAAVAVLARDAGPAPDVGLGFRHPDGAGTGHCHPSRADRAAPVPESPPAVGGHLGGGRRRWGTTNLGAVFADGGTSRASRESARHGPRRRPRRRVWRGRKPWPGRRLDRRRCRC